MQIYKIKIKYASVNLAKIFNCLRHCSCIKRFEQFVQRAIFDRQSCLRGEEKESEEEIMAQLSKR